MINGFSQKAKEYAELNKDFPLDEVRAFAKAKNRTEHLYEYQLLGLTWFAAKILMPNRVYVFSGTKPQIDHIFPMKLEEHRNTKDYQKEVDVLWNFQPIPATINNFKNAEHPLEFFQSKEGSKYFKDYDFLPELTSDIWNDWQKFIAYRKDAMLSKLRNHYGLELESENKTANS